MAVNLRDEQPDRLRHTTPHRPDPPTNMKGMMILAVIVGAVLLGIVGWVVANFVSQHH